jgi:hypothetical protein
MHKINRIRTQRKVAVSASRVLRDKRSAKKTKALAASALVNRKKRT